ncbi:3-hydroxyisobutyrate dehydrogenase [Azonexus fungiphilus]|uniref:3-hydroxyisobutyrate dehydrogenase n=1 Tax=Azonexus fungiphilus TaxID=146940 RepID=A0A495VL12_9RHOO|nr:NAD(P)-dependent oxidoreductase [Azonexus fungiphilus]RKT49942.1 3-hydroxyisobutyrate dehydrogenase [Azonexus fungiphilus]
MSNIAFLGLGAMGSRMAARLLKAGYQVTVWNRSPEASAVLAKLGAQVASTPRAAAAEADFVIAMVRDDSASRFVWLDPESGALGAMGPNAVAIDSSTLSRNWIFELAKASEASGIQFLEAPVSGSRPQAEAGQLIYFLGGSEETVRRAEPVLNTLGSAIHHVGALGSAAMTKLATNALLGIQVTAMAELISILKHSGVDVGRVLESVAGTVVCSPFAKRAADSMLAGNFAPQFPVELVAKDFAYVLASAPAPESAPTLAAAQRVFAEAERCGLGGEHLTSVVKLFPV